MSPLLLLLLAQPASQPASQPAQLRPGGTVGDLSANVTWIYEIDEEVFKIQESWTVDNNSGKLVPKDGVRFEMPQGTRRVTLDEDATGFEAEEDGTAVFATTAIGAGQRKFGDAHLVDFSGATAVIRRTIPVRTIGARLILQDIDGLEVTSNVEFLTKTSELNGLNFRIVNFSPIEPGTMLEVRFDGLPSQVTWPRRASIITVLLILGWAAWSMGRPKPPKSAGKMSGMSAEARRDQIVKAIEILDRDFSAEKIKEKRYKRRHKELMKELATVLREIEIA